MMKRFKQIGLGLTALGFIVFLAAWWLLAGFRFLIPQAPNLLGFFGERNYLILFQNNYELRPTGGFISSYGVLSMKAGIPRGLAFHDVYGEIDEHPYTNPPAVLGQMLEHEDYDGHSFRDANFHPDFPTSNDELLEFYALIHPEENIHGVVAVDFSFLERLVGIHGEIEVDGYQLTEANLFETLTAKVSDIDRHNEAVLAERKNISGPLVKAIMKQTPFRLKATIEAARDAFDEKHLLAHFKLPRTEASFAKRGWNGALPSMESGDFLATNHGNYGGMKSNRYLHQDIQYTLEVSNKRDIHGNPVVTADVVTRVQHLGSWNVPLSGTYTGYVRTLIPEGARVILGGSVQEDLDGLGVIAEFLRLEPGEQDTLHYRYELPGSVWKDGSYHLNVIKQPGTFADLVTVNVRLPQDHGMESRDFVIMENVGRFSGDLNEDLQLSFSVLPDQSAPRIISHKITALNEITLEFSEPMDERSATDPLLYKLEDLNFANEESDELKLVGIELQGHRVILRTTGMSEVYEERYSVTMRGLKDSAGNKITPSPRSVTVVQRLGES